MNEFYVGYLPRVPERLGRYVLRIVLAIGCFAILLALLIVFNQRQFATSTFEYLQYRDYHGTVVQLPYPTLLTRQGPYLLVAPGKHGASELVAGMNLHTVQLRGSLIQRGDRRMLEIVPGSIRAVNGGWTFVRQLASAH